MIRDPGAWGHLVRQYGRAVVRIYEDDRDIFLGHRVEELSYRQLAERHGVSVVEVEEAMIRSLRVIAQSVDRKNRSEEHTSELQSLMRISYAVFCLKKKKKTNHTHNNKNRQTKEQYKQHQPTTNK